MDGWLEGPLMYFSALLADTGAYLVSHDFQLSRLAILQIRLVGQSRDNINGEFICSYP